MSTAVLGVCVVFVGLTLRSQIWLTLQEPLAIASGIAASTHRTAFLVLLAWWWARRSKRSGYC